jgi:hypothetical protein
VKSGCTYREFRKRRLLQRQHTTTPHTRSDKPHSSGEATKLLATTRARDQTLSGAARSAVAAAEAAAIGGTALGARPEVEEAEAERKEAGRGKRSLEVEGPEEEEERAQAAAAAAGTAEAAAKALRKPTILRCFAPLAFCSLFRCLLLPAAVRVGVGLVGRNRGWLTTIDAAGFPSELELLVFRIPGCGCSFSRAASRNIIIGGGSLSCHGPVEGPFIRIGPKLASAQTYAGPRTTPNRAAWPRWSVRPTQDRSLL